MNQGVSSAAARLQLAGTSLAGLGAGILGAGLLGCLLGLSCTSQPIVLPVGALLGLGGAIAIISALGINPRDLVFSPQKDSAEPGYSTFERIGAVNADTEVRGGSSMYEDKDLE